MRVQIQCPKCNHKHFLEDSAIPPGGARVTCRSCGYKWETRPLRDNAALPELDAALDEAAGPPPASRGDAGPSPASGQSFISCPGCGLRFVVVNAVAAGASQAGAGPEPGSAPAAGRSSAAAGRSAGAAQGAPGSQGKTILVVEDVEYFTTLARNTLGRKYRTITVANVKDALKVIDNESIDLLVLDLTLQEGEDGRAILRNLRSKSFPVLIFTARDETEMYGETWKELQGLGADDMLIKGLNVEEDLLLKVGTLLGKR